MPSESSTTRPDRIRQLVRIVGTYQWLVPELDDNIGDTESREDYDRHYPLPSSRFNANVEEKLSKLFHIHSANILTIMKRYMPADKWALAELQFNPRRNRLFDFYPSMTSPLDALNPEHFSCKTELIVIIKDKTAPDNWGSKWACALLEEFNNRQEFPLCFTLLNEAKEMISMLNQLPSSITKKFNFFSDLRELEQMLVMQTLSRIFQFWNIPMLIVDTGPRYMLDYQSILSFAKRAKIKVFVFGPSKRERTDANHIGMKSIKMVDKIIEFRENLERQRKNEEIAQEAADKFEDELKYGFLDSAPYLPPLKVNLDDPFLNMEEYLHTIPQAFAARMKTIPYHDGETLEEISPKHKNMKQQNPDTVDINGKGVNEKNEKTVSDDSDKVINEDNVTATPLLVYDDDDDSDWENLSDAEPGVDPSSSISAQTQILTTVKTPEEQDAESQVSANDGFTVGYYPTTPGTLNYVGGPMPGLSPASDTEADKMTSQSVRIEKNVEISSARTSDFGDVEQRCFDYIRPPPVPENEYWIPPILDNPPYVDKTANLPLNMFEQDQLKALLSDFDKNQKLRRLLKYYRKMIQDYNSARLGKEPKHSQRLDFIRGYTQGRSSCLEIEPDEWRLYMRPANRTISPYEINYLNKTMLKDTEKPRDDKKFKVWLLKQSTSVFIDSILNIYCGGIRLAGPGHLQHRIKTVVFIHDNNDVLELLSYALWFCGKTALATIQSYYYRSREAFENSLEACRRFSQVVPKDEMTQYLDWFNLGMDQVLGDDECRFLIVDCPRPGVMLKQAFDAIMKRLKQESKNRGIDTLYVSKPASRADNLATVEKVLDQIQNKMKAKDRIVFRRSRKIYLDAKLYLQYEKHCRTDAIQERDWGLPQTDNRLWEQLCHNQFQFFIKRRSKKPPPEKSNETVVEVSQTDQPVGSLVGNADEFGGSVVSLDLILLSDSSDLDSEISELETLGSEDKKNLLEESDPGDEEILREGSDHPSCTDDESEPLADESEIDVDSVINETLNVANPTNATLEQTYSQSFSQTAPEIETVETEHIEIHNNNQCQSIQDADGNVVSETDEFSPRQKYESDEQTFEIDDAHTKVVATPKDSEISVGVSEIQIVETNEPGDNSLDSTRTDEIIDSKRWKRSISENVIDELGEIQPQNQATAITVIGFQQFDQRPFAIQVDGTSESDPPDDQTNTLKMINLKQSDHSISEIKIEVISESDKYETNNPETSTMIDIKSDDDINFRMQPAELDEAKSKVNIPENANLLECEKSDLIISEIRVDENLDFHKSYSKSNEQLKATLTSDLNGTEIPLLEISQFIQSVTNNSKDQEEEVLTFKESDTDNPEPQKNINHLKNKNYIISEIPTIRINVKTCKTDSSSALVNPIDCETSLHDHSASTDIQNAEKEEEVTVLYRNSSNSFKENSSNKDEGSDEELSLRRCKGIMNLFDQEFFGNEEPHQLELDPISSKSDLPDKYTKKDEICKALVEEDVNDKCPNQTIEIHKQQSKPSKRIRNKDTRKVEPVNFKISDNDDDWEDIISISPWDITIPKKSLYTKTRKKVTTVPVPGEASWKHSEMSEIPLNLNKSNGKLVKRSKLSSLKILRSRVGSETQDCTHEMTEDRTSQFPGNRRNPQRCSFQFVEIFLKPCRTIFACCLGLHDSRNCRNNLRSP